MARRLQIYPKATLRASTWHLVVKVYDVDLGVQSRFEHTVPAGISTPHSNLRLLKLAFSMTVPDGTLDSAIDDALFTLDIRPGAQTATVWGNWQAAAETIVASLPSGYTVKDFWAAWTRQDTAKTRNDARRALITLQSGWTIDVGSVHQHEGDGTVTEE